MLRHVRLLSAILIVMSIVTVSDAVDAPPQQDNNTDWVQVKPSLSAGTVLTRGSPVQITVQIEYNLASVESGLLELYLAQSAGGCGESDSRLLYPQVEIPIQRGKHKLETQVTWPGDTGEGLNPCILGTGYVGFVPMLFAEENGLRTKRLNASSALTGCIPFHPSGSQTSTRADSITVNATADPQVVSPAGTNVVAVIAKNSDGLPIPNARVAIGAGIGTFLDSGANRIIGYTNDQGRYVTVLMTPPPGKLSPDTRVIQVLVCVFKDGFQGSQQRLQLSVKP